MTLYLWFFRTITYYTSHYNLVILNFWRAFVHCVLMLCWMILTDAARLRRGDWSYYSHFKPLPIVFWDSVSYLFSIGRKHRRYVYKERVNKSDVRRRQKRRTNKIKSVWKRFVLKGSEHFFFTQIYYIG